MKRYDETAEGAIYRKRKVFDGSKEAVDELMQMAKQDSADRDIVSECQAFAIEVLQYFFHGTITLAGRRERAHLDGVEIPLPNPSESPDLVADAIELLDIANAVKEIEADVFDPAFAEHRDFLRRRLTHAAYTMGQTRDRISIRWEGHERRAKFTIDRENDLRKVGEPITPQARALLAGGISYRKLAKACGVTEKIARRWHREHNQRKS